MNNKIVCVGRNYVAHAEELGNEVPKFPLIFLKPFSTVIKSGEKIVHPDYSNDMHHEVELVLKIGRTVKNISEAESMEAVEAYTVGLDMTLRDIQNELKAKGHPWTLAKVFDGAAVLADFTPASKYKLTGKEKITLRVNGIVKQNSTLDLMIFNSAKIISFISSKTTLEAGDLIFTGTPAGVGVVKRGDKIDASIENIAELSTEVV